MSLQCSFCNFEANSREQLAGHISGHVRKCEISKRKTTLRKHQCMICNLEFNSGPSLGGHMRLHTKFELLQSDGSRKRHIIFENGHRCQICCTETWLGKQIPLTLDHIDGNTDNNLRENLRVICPNCHAQTDTFCGKNVGKFPTVKRTKSRGKYYLSQTIRENLPS